MRTIKFNLLMLLVALLGYSNYAKAVSESEPNDLWNQADIITLGATGTGAISPAGEVDWWRVNSPLDGKLTINFSSLNGQYLYCDVVDTLGVIVFATGVTTTNAAVNVDGLAAGTYYIQLRPYYGNGTPTYSFIPTWLTPAEVVDVEPNATKAQAKTLPLNGTKTGHINYYFNSKRDTLDWWKVIANKDGLLQWTITSGNGQHVYAQLFDNDGVTYLGGGVTTSSSTFSVDGLAAGTYFIKISTYFSNGFVPYTLSNTLVLPPVASDVEPNGKPYQALTINLNDSLGGHIGYYYNHSRDTLDWYKVITTLDGQLNLTMNSLNGQHVYFQLIDGDSSIVLGGGYTTGTTTWAIEGLAAGTYYFKVVTYYNNGWAPYAIKLTQTLAPVTIDAEPNGKPYQALTINLNDSLTGHIGYYYNHYRDTLDWYKVTTTLDGQLNFTMNTLNGQHVYLQLFDGDSSTYLGGGYTTSITAWSVDGLAAGTYYLKVVTYYNNGWAPYAIKLTQTVPPVTIDAEPNGTRALATVININDSIVGHVNYYYKNVKDTFDYRKITLTSNGKLEWTITTLNGQHIYAQLFDNDGATYIAGSYTTTAANYTADGLAPGTYYLRMNTYYPYGFVPYILKTAFTPAGNDPEPNGTYATAKAINLNDSLLGAVGYYYNGVRDTSDWLKVATTNDGQLNIKLYGLNGNNVWMQVYDENGITQLYSNYTSGGVLSYSRNDLAKGNYYVRVLCYYNYQFTPYALVNSLVYNNPNDGEPNGYAKLGKVISGYSTKSGNINYYYGGARDTNDWWKIAYYSGALNININKVQHTFDAAYPDLVYKLFKDTNAAPIDNQNLTGAGPFAFSYPTGLTNGTYYIKISQLTNTFGGYSINAQYKDTTSQLISRIVANSDTSCGIGQLSYTVYRGKGPYSVQLYKDGIAYGSPVITPDTAKFTLLDAGYYSVRTNSTLAVTTFVWGTDTALVPKVQGLAATSITATSAIAKWTNLPCADGYKFQWRLKGATGWTTIILKAGVAQDTLTGLVASTKYQFRVYAYTTYNSVKYFSKVTANVTFKTTAARMSTDIVEGATTTAITVNPNPVTDYIQFELPSASEKVLVTITNSIGQTVKSIEINNPADVNQSIDVSALKTGVYMLTIDAKGTRHHARFVKE